MELQLRCFELSDEVNTHTFGERRQKEPWDSSRSIGVTYLWSILFINVCIYRPLQSESCTKTGLSLIATNAAGKKIHSCHATMTKIPFRLVCVGKTHAHRNVLHLTETNLHLKTTSRAFIKYFPIRILSKHSQYMCFCGMKSSREIKIIHTMRIFFFNSFIETEF